MSFQNQDGNQDGNNEDGKSFFDNIKNKLSYVKSGVRENIVEKIPYVKDMDPGTKDNIAVALPVIAIGLVAGATMYKYKSKLNNLSTKLKKKFSGGHNFGKRKSRKTRKSRKSRKTRKSIKTRKSRKSRTRH
jgi:hypothetical protein